MDKILSLVKKHNEWRNSCINLIASENVMSPLCEKLYVSDLMHRYAEGTTFRRFYRGLRHVDEIEALAEAGFRDHFGANFTDIRPISGTISNYAVFSAIGGRGDRILSLGIENGSHVSHEKAGAAGVLGYEVDNLCYDSQLSMDLERSIGKILEQKPRFIVIGGSVILFPQPVAELRKACDEVGAKIVYDAAHVFGLIAAGVFQDPLKEGADIITTSTHKTFPGPQGGLILGNVDPETAKKIQLMVFPGFSSNHHLHRIPALYMALKEMQAFGKDYARQIVANAKTLARELADSGFNVLGTEKGFTETHQIVVDCGKPGAGHDVAEKLEQANIILNKNIIPGNSQSPKNPKGIRIGVQEMTRFGMKGDEMKKIAKLVREAVFGERSLEAVRHDAVSLREDFREVQYCFNKDLIEEV